MSHNVSLFTHTLYKGYYDIPNTCGPDDNVCQEFDFENPRGVAITPSNLPQRAAILAEQFRKKSEAFLHSQVLVPLGDDFKYKSIEFTEPFLKQYDMLINYINEHASNFKMKVQYSTLADYFNAVRNEKAAFPVMKGDFLVYSDKNEVRLSK
jgi:alpha-mannosidase II